MENVSKANPTATQESYNKTGQLMKYGGRGELINKFIKNLKLAGGKIIDTVPNGWYVTNAKFGVAENGAVWVEDYNKELFLSEFVAVKMPKKIVPTMHEAMELIENPGIFISGPSKTADVESFLVFGAHGPVKFSIIFE